MDQSAAPWRLLEDGPPGDPASAAAPAAGRAGTVPGARAGVPAIWLVAILVAAALAAGGAIWLVATNGGGSLVVEGAGPGPGRSDPVAATERSPTIAKVGDLVGRPTGDRPPVTRRPRR